jgi:2-methylcitrate dehydratase PrpD
MHKPRSTSLSTLNVTSFLARAHRESLREEVVEKAKSHIVDTFAAIISGSKLNVGVRALSAIPAFSGGAEAAVIGRPESLPAYAAAMINAMLAHADETDDSHEMSKFHPGCAVLPAALALAQREQRGGLELIRGVVGGYDLGARILERLNPMAMHNSGHSTHACGALFGAGAAASIMMRFDANQAQRMLSYLAQELSGLTCWMEDHDHVQKAYVFGGMAAKNALIAATLTQCGWTGVEEALVGSNRVLDVFGHTGSGRSLEEPFVLGEEILRSNIKKWCVGSPIQAALDSLLALSMQTPIDAADILRLEIELPSFEASVVDNRDMPNINVQHLAAIFILDGHLTFDAAHDVERFRNPTVRSLREKITLIASDALQEEGGRQSIVSIVSTSGDIRTHRTRHVRGTWGNPMTREEVNAKAQSLMEPILGQDLASRLLLSLWQLEKLSAVELDSMVRSIRFS